MIAPVSRDCAKKDRQAKVQLATDMRRFDDGIGTYVTPAPGLDEVQRGHGADDGDPSEDGLDGVRVQAGKLVGSVS